PDRPPATAGPYTDIIAIRMGSVIASAVLDYQRRTGKGCYIDLSQFEASLHFLAPLILEYQATGNLLSRMGNRSLTDCPHGVFPCQGHDRWCAISVTTDSEWQVFCRVMGQPEWAREPRFATIEARKANEDELENRIAQWSRQFSPDEVVTQLREVGLRVGMVADSEDILKDPQLHHRDHFIAVKHPEAGEYYHSAPGFRLEKAVPVVQPAPALGEHNRYVCTQILGLSDEEFSTCLGSGVFE
ncbi:MAG: CoA transferase, partial [Chloroflexi bacterium]|nr:CoA transferase [Chloroflexota bacterium]